MPASFGGSGCMEHDVCSAFYDVQRARSFRNKNNLNDMETYSHLELDSLSTIVANARTTYHGINFYDDFQTPMRALEASRIGRN